MNQDRLHDLPLATWAGAAALGALAMYLLDPHRGAARRARSGQHLRQLGHRTADAIDGMVHQFGAQMQRARGAAGNDASTPVAVAPGGIVERVGRIERGGHAKHANYANHAEHDSRRSAALAGGSALSLIGLLSPRSPLAAALGFAGLALLARGSATRPPRSTQGSAGAAPRLFETSIRIDATPEQLFDVFASYENFPRYLSNVVEVRDLGERRSHWVVKGPAGTEFSWNARLTEHSRPRRLAWETEPGAQVEQAGTIDFEPVRHGTRVTVRLQYRPPAGALGHAVATLLGSNPKRQMVQDLTRMKALIERGPLLAGAAGTPQRAGAEQRLLH